MAWRRPTVSDLAATLSQKEMDAYRQSAGFDGADPCDRLVGRTCAMVRGYCQAGRVKLSGAAEEIPESLVSPAMDYAAYDVLKRLPVPVGEDRRRARDQALELFQAVASGDFVPEPPDEEAPGSTTAAMPAHADARPPRLLD